MQSVIVPFQGYRSNRVAFGLGSLKCDVIFLAAKVYDSFGSVFKCHCPPSFANCDSLWAETLWVEVALADVMVGEYGSVEAGTKAIQDANELARFLIIVLAGAKERGNRLGYDKLRLYSFANLNDLPKQGYIRLPVVYQCRAKAELMDDKDTFEWNVAALLGDFLEGGK